MEGSMGGNISFTITFVKFQLAKYEFDIYKGFFMEKMTQIC
jgi:hypothetical protein